MMQEADWLLEPERVKRALRALQAAPGPILFLCPGLCKHLPNDINLTYLGY